jgi:hypothetical protein
MRRNIIFTLKGLTEIYDKVVSDELIEIWVSILKDLTPEELAKGVHAYVIGNHPFFPKPGQIYVLARPQIDTDQEASLIADRIFSSIRSYGTDPLGTERARNKIGELGWQYIQNEAGWDSFSRSIKSEDDIPILKAQVRRSLMGLIERKKKDIDQPVAIGEPVRTLESLGIQMKQLNDVNVVPLAGRQRK